jgi:hypothetical protein
LVLRQEAVVATGAEERTKRGNQTKGDRKNLAKVRKRKYIAPGYVWSLTNFFSVPKGDQDICMVYNGTSSGLNDSLWVPSFPLPTVD